MLKTPFFKVIGGASINDKTFDAEWRVCEQSRYYGTPYLYKDNGFKERKKAEELVRILSDPLPSLWKLVKDRLVKKRKGKRKK